MRDLAWRHGWIRSEMLFPPIEILGRLQRREDAVADGSRRRIHVSHVTRRCSIQKTKSPNGDPAREHD
jgi:hypothetical protein